MALTYRFTDEGKQKQAADELEGWKAICNTTQGQQNTDVNAVVSQRDAAGVPTAIDTNHANYAAWKDAHKNFTKKARQERQRQQEAAANPPPAAGPIQACHVDPALNVRDTIRVAILDRATSETAGTRLGKNSGRSIADLLKHIDKSLENTDKELARRDRHQEAHDLRIQGHPPVRVFVAAEWYFRPEGTAYTPAQKQTIITGLEKISRKYTDWLIIPGSIYWTPDNLANPPVNVYNQAPVLFAGAVIKTRTKWNEHDIPTERQDTHEIWGMDNPAVLPAGVTAASTQTAIFNNQGIDWCLDICRDHYVGEGVRGYAATAAGADVYVVISNDTAIADEFIAAINNGILIHCDGAAQGVHVYRVTRPGGLNALNAQITNYNTAFVAERNQSLALATAQRQQAVFANDPHYQTFINRYRGFAGGVSSDPVLKGQLETLCTGNDNLNNWTREAFFIEEILTNNHTIGGQPTTAAEQASMGNFYPLKRQEGMAADALAQATPAKTAAKAALAAAATVTKNEIAQQIAHAPAGDLSVYELIDR
ncbi:MAG: hypothetical protein ACYTHJ_06745 [Planctomycetota bacterium]|jgi:hypothetical protein